MGMGYHDSDVAPMNVLGMSFEEYLGFIGWIDTHQDDHALASAGDKFYYLIRIPDDATHRYFAKIEVHANTFTGVTVTRTPFYPGGSGTTAALNNIHDGASLRTVSTILREGVEASGITVGSGMNWHGHFGASGDHPQIGSVGGKGGNGIWRGLANATEYLVETEAVDDGLKANINISLTKLKLP